MKRKYLKLLSSALSVLIIASTFVGVSASAIARGYSTADPDLKPGMVAALSADGDTSSVERASPDNSSRVVGVVTTLEDTFLSVKDNSNPVLVVDSGEVDVFVSNINGDIQKGDSLVLSQFRGIAQKASPDTRALVLGVVIDSVTGVTGYQYTEGGQVRQTQVGKVRLNLKYQATAGVVANDSSLDKLGRLVTGREVNELRLVIAMVVFFLVLIAEGGLLYGAISGAMTAIGRNPLARKNIRGEVVRVIGAALVVLAIGLGAVYAILWV